MVLMPRTITSTFSSQKKAKHTGTASENVFQAAGQHVRGNIHAHRDPQRSVVVGAPAPALGRHRGQVFVVEEAAANGFRAEAAPLRESLRGPLRAGDWAPFGIVRRCSHWFVLARANQPIPQTRGALCGPPCPLWCDLLLTANAA